jgi:hypothetical protein
MKAVYSFGSHPFFVGHHYKNIGQFYNLEMFYLCFALSVLQTKKFFGNAHLYTDFYGKLLLNEILHLFDSVTLICDNLTENEKQFWPISKIKTHELQTEPYIIIDYDIFLWEPLPDRMLNAQILGQNTEPHDIKFYYDSYHSYKDECDSKNPIIKKYIDRTFDANNKDAFCTNAINCGLVGGHNIKMLKQYAKDAIEIINNCDDTKKLYFRHATFIEQWFLGMFCEEHKIPVEIFGAGWGWAKILNYTHLLSDAKMYKSNFLKIKNRVEKDYNWILPSIYKAVEINQTYGLGSQILHEL